MTLSLRRESGLNLWHPRAKGNFLGARFGSRAAISQHSRIIHPNPRGHRKAWMKVLMLNSKSTDFLIYGADFAFYEWRIWFTRDKDGKTAFIFCMSQVLMCHLLLPLIAQDAANNLCFVVVCGASMGCGGAEGAVPGREGGQRGSNETVGKKNIYIHTCW